MSLLSRFRAWYCAPMPTLPPAKMVAPQPWPEPPEASCFIKGLAKSLREAPEDEWSWVSVGGRPPWDAIIRHIDLDVEVWMRWEWRRGERTDPTLSGCTWLKWVHVSRGDPKPFELTFIAQSLEARPRRRFADHIAKVKADADLARRTTDHFTALGCPPTQP